MGLLPTIEQLRSGEPLVTWFDKSLATTPGEVALCRLWDHSSDRWQDYQAVADLVGQDESAYMHWLYLVCEAGFITEIFPSLDYLYEELRRIACEAGLPHVSAELAVAVVEHTSRHGTNDESTVTRLSAFGERVAHVLDRLTDTSDLHVAIVSLWWRYAGRRSLPRLCHLASRVSHERARFAVYRELSIFADTNHRTSLSQRFQNVAWEQLLLLMRTAGPDEKPHVAEQVWDFARELLDLRSFQRCTPHAKPGHTLRLFYQAKEIALTYLAGPDCPAEEIVAQYLCELGCYQDRRGLRKAAYRNFQAADAYYGASSQSWLLVKVQLIEHARARGLVDEVEQLATQILDPCSKTPAWMRTNAKQALRWCCWQRRKKRRVRRRR